MRWEFKMSRRGANGSTGNSPSTKKNDKFQKYLLKLVLKSTSRKVKKKINQKYHSNRKQNQEVFCTEICTESTDCSTKILLIKKSLHDLLPTINPEATSEKASSDVDSQLASIKR